jgi:hypothetical protein
MTTTIKNIGTNAGWDDSTFANRAQLTSHHSWSLRALGQALEKFGFSNFDLEISDGTYLIIPKPHSPERSHISLKRLLRQFFQPSSMPAGLITSERKPDLRFSSEDIKNFDLRGKSRRKDGGKIPDPYGVSELLRGAGCYLDNHNVTSEVKISLVDRWVTIRYRAGDGRPEHIERDIEYFYDYGVNMYLRRTNRVNLVTQTSASFCPSGS